MEPYIPNDLPIKELDFARLITKVGKANEELARYDGLLQGIVNPEVLLSPLTTQEAVLSSKIEGTQATVDEVLEQEAGLVKEGEKYMDIQEIVNYRFALMLSKDYLVERPFSLSYVRELHKILLNSVRGQDKTPGEFRKDQNWIGKPGCSIDEASFVPPSPLIIDDYLNRWQNYIEFDDCDALIQTAIVHAQFELLHPFKDGNGRIGRILIPLFLYKKEKLSHPMFYLSAYLENNRDEYYSRLGNISGSGDWNGWIEFFLTAVVEQAKENSRKVKLIMDLYERMKITIQDLTHSQYSIQMLDAIFDKPIASSKTLAQTSKIPPSSAKTIIRKLKDSSILVEKQAASGSRSAIMCFAELLNIAEGKVFV